jgi:cell division inhibitor SulA
MSIKRAARLAARRAAEEAEAAHLDLKYGTRCTSAFLAERVRWNEDYGAASPPVLLLLLLLLLRAYSHQRWLMTLQRVL